MLMMTMLTMILIMIMMHGYLKEELTTPDLFLKEVPDFLHLIMQAQVPILKEDGESEWSGARDGDAQSLSQEEHSCLHLNHPKEKRRRHCGS